MSIRTDPKDRGCRHLTLDGEALQLPGSIRFAPEELKVTKAFVSGRRRTFRPAWGAQELANPSRIFPTARIRQAYVLPYQVLSQYRLIETLLALSAPHHFVAWHWETVSWQSNGSGVEFHLPWVAAPDVVAVPSGASGHEARTLQVWRPVGGGVWKAQKVDEYEVVPVVTETFDGGAPGGGIAWWEAAGNRVKLPAALSVGLELVSQYVPLVEVDREKLETVEYPAGRPVAEPRTIVLREV